MLARLMVNMSICGSTEDYRSRRTVLLSILRRRTLMQKTAGKAATNGMDSSAAEPLTTVVLPIFSIRHKCFKRFVFPKPRPQGTGSKQTPRGKIG